MANQNVSSQPQQGKSFALDNLSYDLVTILHEKSKGLEAYDKYMRDAQGDKEVLNLLEQIRREDERHVQQLRQVVARCLGGNVNMGQNQNQPRS